MILKCFRMLPETASFFKCLRIMSEFIRFQFQFLTEKLTVFQTEEFSSLQHLVLLN